MIAENCHELVCILPLLTRDTGNIEDVLKMEGDDPADAARYGLKSRLRPGQKPLEQRVIERVTATDPTTRAIQIRRLLDEEHRRAQPVLRPGRGPRGFAPRRWRGDG